MSDDTLPHQPQLVNPGNDPFGPALEDLGEQDGTSFVWDTNVASGTSVSFALKDSTGAIALTAPETVQ
ncbi:hypothetical protein CVT26_007916 [Gymnopilus dilepis]|uniref:Cadherin domain-containing protein n=1 Tax=Gymnopilus dilepis TaxID=231916 RepID=A0A409YKG6_9AGAR|nr:hypothetical protein CVT26_007916 [Gymnopilus dilepis]